MRHASAHLRYTSPLLPSQGIGAWFNTVVPKHSSESTFFAVNAHGYGYMGLQQVETFPWFEGTGIFSIWDAGCADAMAASDCPEDQRVEVYECGDYARCDRFGGEGTGYKAIVTFDEWELEQSYSFAVLVSRPSAGKVQYDGYMHAPELGGWILLAKLLANEDTSGRKPWYIHDLLSFVEQWDASQGEDVRWGRFGPTFVEDAANSYSWSQIQQAAFTHTSAEGEDTTHVHANVTDGGARWGLGIGGSLVRRVRAHETLTVAIEGQMPAQLVEFNTLRVNGNLPGGCRGGTCVSNVLAGWVNDAFSKKYLPFTLVGMSVFCCFCCWGSLQLSKRLGVVQLGAKEDCVCGGPQGERESPAHARQAHGFVVVCFMACLTFLASLCLGILHCLVVVCRAAFDFIKSMAKAESARSCG